MQKCFYCYDSLVVLPTVHGDALIQSCTNNGFRRENRFIAKKRILDSWNSKEFQFQRKQVAAGSWNYCFGANCCYDPSLPEMVFEDDDIRQAIKNKYTKISYFPKRLFLIPSYVCNNQCSFCYQKGLRKKGVAPELRKHYFDELLDDIMPHVEQLAISGGDPLASPCVCDFLRNLMDRYPEVRKVIFTNGIAIDDEWIRRARNANTSFKISLYGMTEKTYYSVAKTHEFYRVFHNIQKLLSLGHFPLYCSFVVSRETVDELDDFCSFVGDQQKVVGLVTNNCYEGEKYVSVMADAQKKYAHISSRLFFMYQNERWYKGVFRTLFNPWHSFRYFLFKPVQ